MGKGDSTRLKLINDKKIRDSATIMAQMKERLRAMGVIKAKNQNSLQNQYTQFTNEEKIDKEKEKRPDGDSGQGMDELNQFSLMPPPPPTLQEQQEPNLALNSMNSQQQETNGYDTASTISDIDDIKPNDQNDNSKSFLAPPAHLSNTESFRPDSRSLIKDLTLKTQKYKDILK